jgi:hypothetical protein
VNKSAFFHPPWSTSFDQFEMERVLLGRWMQIAPLCDLRGSGCHTDILVVPSPYLDRVRGGRDPFGA